MGGISFQQLAESTLERRVLVPSQGIHREVEKRMSWDPKGKQEALGGEEDEEGKLARVALIM